MYMHGRAKKASPIFYVYYKSKNLFEYILSQQKLSD
jgi:hypothetical protein